MGKKKTSICLTTAKEGAWIKTPKSVAAAFRETHFQLDASWINAQHPQPYCVSGPRIMRLLETQKPCFTSKTQGLHLSPDRHG